ncbi:hypothetical protein IGK74_002310 [Enterococcus sp. AZ150]|uniref:hypothetical protein n=1 Tax=Enterococcus sp. AZ150 TaxID=2774866 RepID=UPI003F21CA54
MGKKINSSIIAVISGVLLIIVIGAFFFTKSIYNGNQKTEFPLTEKTTYIGGTSDKGYFFKDTGKIIVDPKKKTISDGEDIFQYKIIKSEQLESQSKKNISKFDDDVKEGNNFFIVLNTYTEEKPFYNFQFGYEISFTNHAKDIKLIALNIEHDYFDFFGTKSN